MVGNKFFDQVSGIVKVKLKGKKQEKVINMALARGIYIWGIKKVDDNIQFKVRNSGWEALQNIADESGYEIEAISEKGLPFFKNVLKRRVGFLSGALIFIVALYMMSSFIWFIEVSGNKNIKSHQIIVTAAKYGIYQGAGKWTFSRSQVEEAMLRDLSNLSYIKIDIRGVKANIEVVEKVLPKKEITGPCHMVAEKDGIVEEVLILEGQAVVKEGTAVARGDILISGVVFPKENPYLVKPEDEETSGQEPYLVRARGNVKAKVWYEGYGECKLKSEKLLLSEQKQTRVFLETPWRTFKLKGNYPQSFALAKEDISKQGISTPIGNFALIKETQQEQVKHIDEYSEKEAIEIAKKKARNTLISKLPHGQKITDENLEVLSAPSDSVIRVKISVETIENIAVPEPLNVDD